jgi:hypothetical protein
VLGISHSPTQTPMVRTGVGDATAFPWTTGRVAVRAHGDSPSFFPTSTTRSGYDNRTPLGAGTIQLVRPMLTHWTGGKHQGHVGILRSEFAPEPWDWLLLVARAGALVVLRRVSRRS